MYVNLKKRIEISHLRRSVARFKEHKIIGATTSVARQALPCSVCRVIQMLVHER